MTHKEFLKRITIWSELAFKYNWINRKVWEDSDELEASLQTYLLKLTKGKTMGDEETPVEKPADEKEAE